MAFRLARRTRGVMVMVRAWPESGFREGIARLWPLAGREYSISPPRDALRDGVTGRVQPAAAGMSRNTAARPSLFGNS